MVWVWTVSLPVTILNSPNVSYGPEGGGSSYFNAPTDIIGVVLFAIGFAIEAVADIQKVTLSIIPRAIILPFFCSSVGIALFGTADNCSINSEATIKTPNYS